MQNPTKSLACLEVRSAALGYRLLNLLTSSPETKVLEASPVDADRFLILAEGPEQVLTDALMEARTNNDATDASGVIDQELVATPHPKLLPTIYSLHQGTLQGALLIVETQTASGLLSVAQALLEHHGVDVIELRIGRGQRGRGLGFFTGDVTSLTSGAEDARTRLRAAVREGRAEVIDKPTQGFKEFFVLTGK